VKKLLILGIVWTLYIHAAPFKTSLIVPCHYTHAEHLIDLLKAYAQQTELPDEIVISLSEADHANQEALKKIKNNSWPFPVLILTSSDKHSAGQNRNIACSHATGDIFIMQDADDMPHPQRIEIIKHFFQTHTVDHVAHFYSLSSKSSSIHYDLTSIPVVSCNNLNKFGGSVANGPVAIARHVFEKVQWPQSLIGEDVAFNKAVYAIFKNNFVLKIVLYYYQTELSAQSLTFKEIFYDKRLSFPSKISTGLGFAFDKSVRFFMNNYRWLIGEKSKTQKPLAHSNTTTKLYPVTLQSMATL
jgi:glycosyltransferase involved in cell wall biosynthesis